VEKLWITLDKKFGITLVIYYLCVVKQLSKLNIKTMETMENYSFTRTNANIKETRTTFSKILDIKENGYYNLKVEFFWRDKTEMLIINDLNGKFETETELQEIKGVDLIIIKPKGWNIKIDVFPNDWDVRITFNNLSYLESTVGNFKFYFSGLHI